MSETNASQIEQADRNISAMHELLKREVIEMEIILLRIACALDEQTKLQRLQYEFMRDPVAQARQQDELAAEQSKYFNPDLQGEQLAAVNIKASQVMAQYQREHPLGVQFTPPRGR